MRITRYDSRGEVMDSLVVQSATFEICQLVSSRPITIVSHSIRQNHPATWPNGVTIIEATE